MNAQTQIAAPHKNVFTALAAAQLEMEPVKKGAINPAFKDAQNGKPKGTPYADLADVVEAVRGPLNRHGMAYFHQIIDGTIMRTSLVHGESETRIDCDVPLLVDRQNMQGMKSATTYAKRIGLESVTGVAPEDDDGNAAAAAAPKSEAKPKARQDAPDAIPATTPDKAKAELMGCQTLDDLGAAWTALYKQHRAIADLPEVVAVKDIRKHQLTEGANA